jgi:protoporphyrinogen oxidase
MTTPNSILSRVCTDLSEDEKSRFDEVDYLGIVCASALLKKPLSPYYVTNITDTWVPMTAVIEMTCIVDREEMDGHSLVYLPKYVPAEHELSLLRWIVCTQNLIAAMSLISRSREFAA